MNSNALFKSTLKEVFESFLDGVDVEWLDDPQPALSDETMARVYLNVTARVGVGRDDHGYEEEIVPGTPPTSIVREVVSGQRVVTVNVTCDVLSQEADENADTVLEKIRTRLRGDVPRATLLAANVALARRGGIAGIPTVRDRRAISSAAMDLFFNVAFSDVLSEQASFIETVEVGSAIEDTDGDLLPSPPNYLEDIES